MKYFVEESRFDVEYLNEDGPCKEQDALIKIILFKKEGRLSRLPDYYVKFYDSGPNRNSPVNPSNADAMANRYQTFIWKKVRPEDYKNYLSFISNGGSYQRIRDLFASRY